MIELRLLGPTELRAADGTEIRSVLVQPKRLALLAFLAAELPLGYHRRESLLALFWPEADDASARNGLRKAIYYLRQACGDDAIVGRGNDEIAVNAERIWCDVPAFAEAVRDGQLARALELYRGDLLTGFALADCGEFEEWLSRLRAKLREQASHAAISLAQQEEAAGRSRSAITILERARELHPDNEDTLRRLLLLQHRGGDRAAVEAAFGKYERYLKNEYDAEPAPETLALIERLRTATEVPERPNPPVLTPHASVPAPAPLNGAEPVHHVPRGRRRSRLAVAFGAVAVALFAGAYMWSSFQPRAGAVAPSLVAVLPLAFHGAPDLQYTSDGLTSLVAAGIDNVAGLRTVNPRLLLSGTTAPTGVRAPEGAAAEARRFGAGTFVLGDVTAAGQRLRINASMYETDASSRARAVGSAVVVEGPVDSLFQLADQLIAGLTSARAAPSSARVSASALKGTASIAALRAFLEGEREFRTGRYDAAIVAYRQAVHIDSGFALADLRMSQAANWTGDGRLQRLADEQAQRLRDRLPTRDRRRAEAWHESLAGRSSVAESLYRDLVAEDPTDVEAWYYLADLVYHSGPASLGKPASESRAEWQHVLALEPHDASALLHLARLAAADGDRAGFDSLMTRIAAVDPSTDVAIEARAVRAFAFGDAAARVTATNELANKSSRVAVAVDVAGHVMATSNDLSGVSALWAAIEHDPSAVAYRGEIALHKASVALARGQLHDVDASVDTSFVFTPSMALRYRGFVATLPFIAPRPAALARVSEAIARGDTISAHADARAWRTYFSGVIALRRGDAAEAARQSVALDHLTDSAAAAVRARRLAPLLRAELALHAGRTADALAALGTRPFVGMAFLDPSSGLASGQERWLRGEVLAKLGRTREALQVFSSFPEPAGADAGYASVAELRRGELYEALGERDTAATHYRRAIGYWAHSDGELREMVGRAQAGLRRVAAQ